MKKMFFLVLFVSMFILQGFVMADSEKMLNPDNGHYYQRIDKSMSWTEAKSYCENLGGHLATITSQSENDFIYNNLTYSNNNYYCSLGGIDSKNEGKWEWITGEAWNYENWYSGSEEPNGGTNENCLNFLWRKNWRDKCNDVNCSSKQPCAICECDSSNQCSQTDLDSKYNEGYNKGYEAGKKYCQNNPSACGISTTPSTTNCSSEYNKGYEAGKNSCESSQSSTTIISNSTDNCATFDFITNTLHIPCFSAGSKSYWFDFSLTNSNPVTLQMKKYGTNN